jgi:hypothetical protein
MGMRTYPNERPPLRLLVLPVILGMHLLAFVFFPNRVHDTGKTPGHAQTVLFFLMPRPAINSVAQKDATKPAQGLAKNPAQIGKTVAKPPVNSARPVNAPQMTNTTTTLILAPEARTQPSVSPVQQREPVMSAARLGISEMLENAIQDAGKIDRALRKEFPQAANQIVSTPQTRLKRGIAAAFRPQGPVTLTELTLPDGSPITKVTGPNGSYCYKRESVGLTHGIDQIQNGVKTKQAACP